MARAAAAVAVAVAAACGAPAPGAAPVVASPPPAVAAPTDAAVGPDVPDMQREEYAAALQKAMNDLDAGARGCWAAVAVERFDIAGTMVARIDVGPPQTRAAIGEDTTRHRPLVACVEALLAGYAWPPPLHGRTIQMPFAFRAPDGQNVIDRRLVPWKGQGAVSIAVLLDEASTGNPRTSLLEVAIAAGGSTGVRVAERAELWYFLGAATVAVPRQPARAVAAGDMLFVPAGAARGIAAGSAAAVHAVLAIVPGGREGAARAGALPTPELAAGTRLVAAPVLLPAAAARTFPRPTGGVTLYAHPATIAAGTLSATVLQLNAGAAVPEHVHANETEVLYVLAGAGTMKVRDVAIPVGPTSVVQVPPGVPHSFTATAEVRAVQVYTPAGPEQRFTRP